MTRIVDDLICVSPFDRYQNPTSLLRDLRTALGDQAPVSTGSPAPTVASKPTMPTVLCVEDRHRQQNSLREYFTKHGYRVLMLSDFPRALLRLQSDPPKGLVLMGDSLGTEVQTFVDKAVAACRESGTAIVLVLSKHQLDLKDEITDSESTRVLFEQPVTLRSIRKALEDVWNRPA